MSELPTPAVVPAAHVVMVVVGRHDYVSPLLSQSDAAKEAKRVEDLSTGRDVGGFFGFACADGRRVRIRPLAVSAVECGPPRPRREDRATTVVHNHFADSGSLSVAELVEMQRDSDFLAGSEAKAEPEHTAGCSCGARGDLDFILGHICPLKQS